jgi:hypothetical protein
MLYTAVQFYNHIFRHDWVCLFVDCPSGTKRPECSATRHFIGSNPITLPVFLVLCVAYRNYEEPALCVEHKDFSTPHLSGVSENMQL